MKKVFLLKFRSTFVCQKLQTTLRKQSIYSHFRVPRFARPFVKRDNRWEEAPLRRLLSEMHFFRCTLAPLFFFFALANILIFVFPNHHVTENWPLCLEPERRKNARTNQPRGALRKRWSTTRFCFPSAPVVVSLVHVVGSPFLKKIAFKKQTTRHGWAPGVGVCYSLLPCFPQRQSAVVRSRFLANLKLLLGVMQQLRGGSLVKKNRCSTRDFRLTKPRAVAKHCLACALR